MTSLQWRYEGECNVNVDNNLKIIELIAQDKFEHATRACVEGLIWTGKSSKLNKFYKSSSLSLPIKFG